MRQFFEYSRKYYFEAEHICAVGCASSSLFEMHYIEIIVSTVLIGAVIVVALAFAIHRFI